MNRYKIIYNNGGNTEQIIIKLEDIFTILYDSFKGYKFSYLTDNILNLEYIKRVMFEVEILEDDIIMKVKTIRINKLYDLLQKRLLKSTYSSNSSQLRKDVIHTCVSEFKSNEKDYINWR